jgi:hypothetical protein
MTSAELLTEVRSRFDDAATPYLASDALILEQASLAEKEFALATLALYGVSSGTITGNDPWVTLPSNLIVLKSVILNNVQLRPITASELDFGYYTLTTAENTGRFDNWRAATGTPKFVVTDMYPDKVRLVPYKTTSGSVSIEGYIYPTSLAIGASAVNPQIPAIYHELLVFGTLFRLSMQTDVDLYNPERVQLYSTTWYNGIAEAQNNLRTALRRQVRVMELPRGFDFDVRGPRGNEQKATQ